MKEIDFLPKWYKSSMRRRASYFTQYIGVVVLFVLLLFWNFLSVHSVSKAQAKLSDLESKETQIKSIFKKAEKIKRGIKSIENKAQVLDKVDDRINVSDVLAEISFLLDDNIVLSRLNIEAQTFKTEKKGQNQSRSLRTANLKGVNTSTIHYGDVKFRVIMQGKAINANVVAELICRLEDSDYFFNVIPSYTRNSDLDIARDSVIEKKQASEFEIMCYLANYALNVTAAENTN